LTPVQEGVGSVTEAAEEVDLTKGAVSKIAKKLRNEGKLGPGLELRLF
jgi:DNA-binding transcriptional LysR family regulator